MKNYFKNIGLQLASIGIIIAMFLLMTLFVSLVGSGLILSMAVFLFMSVFSLGLRLIGVGHTGIESQKLNKAVEDVLSTLVLYSKSKK
ncbi:hypothetical protein TH1_057 [Shewanella phage Thanatos-1]|nr:hypothetical protein TH1_057 [Shewanella phage Thanatos-1]QLA10628.1 hypothetical protein TH2_060 [Shewanella phage Thanatos-2]